ATLSRYKAWPVKRVFSRSVVMSQRITVLSELPLASDVPSGEKETERTLSEWPTKVAFSRPEGISQSLTISPCPPDASVRPSGEKARQLIDFVYPVNMVRMVQSFVSQTYMHLLSPAAVARSSPVGSKTAAYTLPPPWNILCAFAT